MIKILKKKSKQIKQAENPLTPNSILWQET